MRHARFPALVVAVALAAAACSSSGADPEPTPSTTAAASESETPSPTPTPTEMDLSAPPPDEVTEEYVQAVLEAIYEVEAETIRIEVEAAESGATTPPEEAIDLLPTIFDGEQLTFALQDTGRSWEDGEFTDVFSSDPSPAQVDIREIVESQADCILATYDLDRSPTLREDREPTHLIALLRPKPDGEDPEGVNPTPWVMTDQGIVTDEMEASCD